MCALVIDRGMSVRPGPGATVPSRAVTLLRVLALCLLGLAVALAPARAQTGGGVLVGTVRSVDGTPLAGIPVDLRGTGFSTRTGQDGTFALRDVPAGRYTVVATPPGLPGVERSVLMGPGETVRLSLEAGERALDLAGITAVGRRSYAAERAVTATKMDAPLLDVPLSVHVVTEDFLEDQNVNRLDDVFRNVSGVNAFSSYQDFTIRGFRTSAALYNGLKASAYGFFVNPKMTNVERVEVLKGPASVLYGSFEPGGLINLVTKVPQARPFREVSLTAGTFDRFGAEVDLTGPVLGNRLLGRLVADYENAGSFRRFQGFTNLHVAPSLSWLVGPATTVIARGEFLYDHRSGQRDRGIGVPGGDFDLLPIAWTVNEPGDVAENRGYTGEVDLEHAFGPRWRVRSAVRIARGEYGNAYHEPRGFVTDTIAGRLLMLRQFRDQEFTDQSRSVDVNLLGDLRTGPVSHTLLFGANGQRLDSRTDGRFAEPVQRKGGTVPALDVLDPVYRIASPESYAFRETLYLSDSRSLGVYAQDLVGFGDHVKALFGLRYDDFQDDYTNNEERGERADGALTLRGGVVLQPIQTASLYASYSEGFAPQDPSSQAQGGPFDPETSWQAEAGSKLNLFGDRLVTTLAAYRIVKENVLVSDPVSEEFRYIQLGEVESRGIEWDAIGSIAPHWSLAANYSRNDAAVSEDSDTANVGKRLPNAPEHAAGFWTRYDLPGLGLGVGAGASYVDERATFDEAITLPAYTVADAALFYGWRSWSAMLKVNNVFDRRHFIGGYNDRTVWPGAPRTVQFTVRTTF